MQTLKFIGTAYSKKKKKKKALKTQPWESSPKLSGV